MDEYMLLLRTFQTLIPIFELPVDDSNSGEEISQEQNKKTEGTHQNLV